MPDDPTPRAAALKCEKTHDPIAKFWNAHDPSGSMFEECKKLGKIMFFKCKKIVSEKYVLQQLKDALELRHEFLEAKGLELNHVLQDGRERADFMTFAKDKYHSDPEQKRLQERDVQEGGNKKMHAGKHSRWSREMQRRCGATTAFSNSSNNSVQQQQQHARCPVLPQGPFEVSYHTMPTHTHTHGGG